MFRRLQLAREWEKILTVYALYEWYMCLPLNVCLFSELVRDIANVLWRNIHDLFGGSNWRDVEKVGHNDIKIVGHMDLKTVVTRT